MAAPQDIALITGASSGIGAEFARQLAPRCKSMILVARRADRLQALAAELAEQGVEAHCLAVDLADPVGVTRVVEAVRQKGPVTLLVNNAGFSTLGPFVEQSPESQQAMVAVHVSATMTLSRAVLPFMKEAGGGAIINVSSLVAFVAMPDVAVYCGTKAFLNSFSEALAQEVAGDNIRVQCLCPGYTRTEFHGRDSFAGFDATSVPEGMWMEPAEVVSESLAALDGGEVVVVAGAGNRELVAGMLAKRTIA